MAGIEMRDLHKQYRLQDKALTVIEDLNLTIADASFVTVLGRSGCGKTTLLRLICGLETLDAGTLAFTVDGQKRSRAQTRVSIVFQEPRLMPWLTVKQNVALAFKVMEMAGRHLWPGAVPLRAEIRLVLGLDPPGLIDGFEYLTRAITQQRAIIDPAMGKGPKSVRGSYCFEVHYRGRKLAMQLKEGALPAGFTQLAGKCLAGIADEDERRLWQAHKLNLGQTIIAADPADLLDVEPLGTD